MKLIEKNYEYLTNIQGEDRKFKIASNPVMFSILREKMYSDIVGTICREITSNARDAHREVGNAEKPIEIWVPGEYYVVKDYGPGISPDRIDNIYTIFGESTKRSSNDETGGFGLGAKTPWAMSSSFIIITIHDKNEYIYEAYIDSSGEGKLKTVSIKPTDKPNGTTIKIPVPADKRKDFYNKTIYYTQHWNLIPIFHGGIPPNPLKTKVEGSCWKIYEENVDFDLLVDDIPYSIKRKSTYSWKPDTLPDGIKIPSGVVPCFSTGEIEISATRESIILSDFSKQAINNKVSIFEKEFKNQVQSAINKCDNFRDVLKILNNPLISQSIMWNWNNNKFTYPSSLYSYNISKVEITYSNRKTQRYTHINSDNFIKNPDAPIIIKDKDELTAYDKGRISYFLENNEYSHGYLIKEGIFPDIPDSYLLSKLKHPQTITKKTNTSKPKIDRKKYIRVRKYSSYTRNDFRSLSINDKTQILYTFESVFKYRKFGASPPQEIYEITAKKRRPKIPPHWIEIERFLKKKVYDKFSSTELEKIISSLQLRRRYHNVSSLEVKEITEFYPSASEDEIQWIRYLVDIGNLKENDKITDKYEKSMLKKFPLIPVFNKVGSYHLKELYSLLLRKYFKGEL